MISSIGQWKDKLVMNREVYNPFLLFIIILFAVLSAVMLLGTVDTYIGITILGGIAFVLALILGLREIITGAVIAVGIYVDWYLGLVFVSIILAFVVLLLFYFTKPPRFTWCNPHAFWIWVVFLIIALFPTSRGITLLDGGIYYCTVVLAAFLMFWLGIVVVQDKKSFRLLLQVLSIIAMLVAIHTIIEAVTGVFLFKTNHYDAQLAQSLNFELSNSDLHRTESFLRNPDTTAGFFATTLFIPLGLFVECKGLMEKLLHVIEIFLMIIALLFTYGLGGWIGAIVGCSVFLLLIGHNTYRILIPLLIIVSGSILLLFFPIQVTALLQHFTSPNEISLRSAVWQTGINIIRVFPLDGIGFGHNIYIIRAEPYRVPSQYVPVIHPHNSYLELAALGGIPILILFAILLLFAMWKAVVNLLRCDRQIRPLFAGSIAAITALSFYCFSNAGWTLAPLAAIGWLLLGATSSPQAPHEPHQTEGKNL